MYGTNNIDKHLQRGGNEQERRPIMRPVGNSRSQDGQGGGYEGPRYDSVQADPLPLSHLRIDEGGYLGPAALENINLEMPSSTAPHHQNVRPSNSEVGNNISTTNNNYPYRGAGKMNPQSVAGSLDMDTSSSYKSERNGGGLYSTLTCRDRSGCEQALLMTGAILLIIIITLAIGIGFINSKGINTQVSAGLLWGGPTCQSQECVKAAGAILESLDESVDPCHNFVQFACGGWHANHPVPEAAFRWSMLDVLDETTLYELKHLLEEPPEEGESLGIQAARKLYQACVNDTAWTEIGLAPLIDIFGEVGGLPLMTPNWTASGYQLESLLAWARRLGWMPIISLAVSPDLVNNSNNAVYLGQGDLELPLGGGSKNASSLKEFRVKFMKRTALELLKVVGLEEDEEAKKTMETDIEELWNFSVKLAEISIPANSITDPWLTYTPVTIDAFTNFTDHEEIPLKVNWLDFIQKTYNGTNITFTGNDIVIVETPTYFNNLTMILNHTSPRTIVNFVLFQIINAMAEETSHALRDIHASFEEKVWTFGRTDLRPWHDCAAKSRILLKVAVGQLYFKKHSLTNIIDMAEQMISDITLSFRNLITSATWMSPNATKEAMTKLDNMIKLVAYPSYIFNDTEMDKHLEGMPEISTTDHFGNVMNLTKWISMRSLMKLSQPPVRRKWVSGPLEINAFYSAIQNALMIPGGVLTPPLFHHEDLPALNYGGIGAIIGHEITHGFDTNGRYFDWRGDLSRGWDNDTINTYLEKSKCFEEQYVKYNVSDLLAPFDTVTTDLKIDPVSSSGENIADNGGLRASWFAYKKHVEDSDKKDFYLPGLQNYNQDQLFFISFAKLWCMQYTPFALQYSVTNDRHPPGHFRVLGALQNSKEFSEAFRCPVGSPLNPERKCLLW